VGSWGSGLQHWGRDGEEYQCERACSGIQHGHSGGRVHACGGQSGLRDTCGRVESEHGGEFAFGTVIRVDAETFEFVRL
jgi:hypothetical protein